MCVKQNTLVHSAPKNATASTMPHVTNLLGSVRVQGVHPDTVFTKARLLVKVAHFSKPYLSEAVFKSACGQCGTVQDSGSLDRSSSPASVNVCVLGQDT